MSRHTIHVITRGNGIGFCVRESSVDPDQVWKHELLWRDGGLQSHFAMPEPFDSAPALVEKVAKLEARIKRLEEAGSGLVNVLGCGCTSEDGSIGPCRACCRAENAWREAF